MAFLVDMRKMWKLNIVILLVEISSVQKAMNTIPTGQYDASTETIYEYDAKKNPLAIGTEAFLISNPGLSASNNPTKIMIVDLTDPTQNITITTTYTYNNSGKPITATNTYQGLGFTGTTTYYY